MVRNVYQRLRDQIWLWHYLRFGRFKETDDTPQDKEIERLSRKRMELVMSNKLFRDLLVYDLDWGDEPGVIRQEGEGPALVTLKGRAHIRKLIDQEKARRFEVKTVWVTKFWVPLLAALIGIVGALTGLVAVLQHKK
jgi:hypothetical protein